MAAGGAPDAYCRARAALQWLLAGACVALTVLHLEGPCTTMHRALGDVAAARAEFGGAALAAPAPAAAWQPGRQDPSLPGDGHDWCTAKVRDVGSWADAARRAGGGDGADSARGGGPPFVFPRIIHQTVEDKFNISCEVLECMATWRALNPGYEHRLYDAAEREALVREHYPELLPVYRALSTPVERADLWRYLALHRWGGVYADSDVRCVAPVSTWNAASGHDADLLVGIVYTDARGRVTRVNNFILAAMPCHPVLASLPFTILARVSRAGLAGRPVGGEAGAALSEAVIQRTGPGALTAAIGAYAASAGAAWPVNATAASNATGARVGRVRLLPRHVMTMGWETAAEGISCAEALGRNPGAYICHQYFGTWKASYSHRPALSYSPACTYWGLAGAAAPPPPPAAPPPAPPSVFGPGGDAAAFELVDDESDDGDDGGGDYAAALVQQQAAQQGGAAPELDLLAAEQDGDDDGDGDGDDWGGSSSGGSGSSGDSGSGSSGSGSSGPPATERPPIMARALAILALALLAGCALAQQDARHFGGSGGSHGGGGSGPCIECNTCKTNNCYSVCSKSCPKPPVTVNGDRCIKFGRDAGWKIGKDACATAQSFCRGGQRSGPGVGRSFPVTLSQCENIAYGACQKKAEEAARYGQCRWSFNGYAQCNRQQFTNFFTAEVNELCNRAVSVIDP
ncbi:och1 [Scenedesmus sp. PABB004]|nr:och1 [Scenedesmus sp. PABB004]